MTMATTASAVSVVPSLSTPQCCLSSSLPLLRYVPRGRAPPFSTERLSLRKSRKTGRHLASLALEGDGNAGGGLLQLPEKESAVAAVEGGEEGDKALGSASVLLGEEANAPEGALLALDFLSEGDLQAVVQDIAVLERQSERVALQMTQHARVLAEASKRLRARAQATRREAAEVKEAARLQRDEELRGREELRLGRARLEEESRRRMQQQGELQAQRAQQERRLKELEGLEQQQKEQRGQAEQKQLGEGTAPEVPVGDLKDLGSGSSGQAAQSAPNGAYAGHALGAAVLPFTFPNGRHSGKEMDSALAHGPALIDTQAEPEGARGGAQTLEEGTGSSTGDGQGNGEPGSLEEAAGQHDLSSSGSSNSSLNVSESMECVIAHPGAMSCTKTLVKKDSANRVAVVSMETTVQCTGDGCLVESLDLEDFAALAMSTLADTAQELKHSRRFQGSPDIDPRVQERREVIVGLLREGEVVECKPMEPPSKFGHESFIVTLRNSKTGEQIKGLFKPRVDGDADGWHRAPVEWVAYELNLLLGMDYIPPVAYRTGGVNLGRGIHYKEGAFLYWVPSARELRKVPATSWGVSVARLLSDTRILDILLNNSDRHHGHFLFGEHWADGRMRVALIDHAAGFRKEASVLMEHENAFQTGPVRCVSAHTYLRLRFLDRAMVEGKFLGVLSPDEITGLLQRKDQVLAYLDQLVQERGYHRTVVE